jgi:hypothetical protein
MTLYQRDKSGQFKRLDRIRPVEYLLLFAGIGVAMMPEVGELSGWKEIEHPSHFARIGSAVFGALLAWCSRFVRK